MASSPPAQPTPSWAPVYTSPPTVKHPYTPSEALGDLQGVCYALETFLNSQMLESEAYCHQSDVGKERLYFATGYGLIQLAADDADDDAQDLLSAINHTKHGNHIASQHRKKAGFLGTLMGSASSTAFIRSMTDVERHAELTYAESLFEKALLGIVYSGDWLAFIKEALNMRTVFGVYRHLGAYLDEADAAYAASVSTSTPDPSIDPHFRSGVYLGVGLCNVILSLIPGKLATLVELFGYKGDRAYGLKLLMRAGGWDDGEHATGDPSTSTQTEGVRRALCDMALLIFHLVVSSYTGAGVDIRIATRILEWNLKRFPN
ncbi:hypothetical protein C0995_005859, partial [Termitomyces sp. Mi166